MAETPPGRTGKTVHPRLPDELHARLAAFAEADHRSLQNAIVYLLDVGLRAEQASRPDDPTLHLR